MVFEFGEEMTRVFHDARSGLPPALAAKISFYRREFYGLLAGALCAHFDGLSGPAISFRRSDMQRQPRFPRSAVFLMLVTFVGVVLTIAEANSIAGNTLGLAWRPLASVLILMVLMVCTAAQLSGGFCTPDGLAACITSIT